MNNENGIFRRALAAMVEGRSRQARRYVETYLKDREILGGGKR